MIVNGIAAVVFLIHGGLAWEAVGLLAAGSLVGGYAGARLALALPAPALRVVVVLIAVGTAVKLLRLSGGTAVSRPPAGRCRPPRRATTRRAGAPGLVRLGRRDRHQAHAACPARTGPAGRGRPQATTASTG